MMNNLIIKQCYPMLFLRINTQKQLPILSRNLSFVAINKQQQQQTRAFSLTSSTRAPSSTSPPPQDHSDQFRPSEELAKERYDSRANEDVDKKRARLLYQSRKRGMLENGVILASFADKFLSKLNPELLDQYDRLINLPTNDWDIYYWATKTKPTPSEFETPVMQMLREHLHSKVSSSDVDSNCVDDDEACSRVPSYLQKNKRPEDIVMPAAKKKYDLDVDVRETDLTNYEQELFDPRIKRLSNTTSIVRMTEWRKERFVRRMRRVISSPVSLIHLSDNDKPEQVFTQRVRDREKNIANSRLSSDTNLLDTNYEKSIKHHKFLQHLMSSDFTDDVQDYDDEAKAWADILWHRNYGSADVTIAPSSIKCTSCNSKLHCCDPGLSGYLPKELFSKLTTSEVVERRQVPKKCQRCQFHETYKVPLDSADIDEKQYKEILRELKERPSSVVCLVIDLTDFPSGIIEGLIDLIGTHHKLIIVGNKLDLLPYDSGNIIDRVKESLRNNLSRIHKSSSNLYINDMTVMSARTGFGIEGLVARVLSYLESPRDVYLIGSSNAGKSTLFNALLQSDLSAIREGDLLSRVSIARLNDQGSNALLRFPTNLAEGWEIELKRRKLKIVERDTAKQERSLINTTKNRQATMPHMSMLIDRVEYLPLPSANEMMIGCNNQDMVDELDSGLPLLSEDHPLKQLKERPILSATPEEFSKNSFCYQYPSISCKDQLHELLTNDERLEVFPNETLIPRKYSLRPHQSIFIAGLARLDLVTSTASVILTIFASKYLPIHITSTRKADKFYNTFLGSSYLGVPFGDEDRLKAWPKLQSNSRREAENFYIRGSEFTVGAADIVLSSIGWALVNVSQDQECVIKAYTPEARGIFLRDPPLLSEARKTLRGRKIRDTPVFINPNYRIDSISTN